jgi:urocanate hydratase
VLRAFEAAPRGLTLHEIVAATDLPAPVIANITTLMTVNGLLKAQSDGTYTPGLELVSLASRVSWVDRLRRVTNPHLVRLRDASGETANLVILDEGQALYIDQVESRHALRHSGWVGRHIPVEGTATGMALVDGNKVHTVTDSIEVGVTAIVCGVKGANSPAAVGITGPTWRMKEAGLRRLSSIVEATASETGADLIGHY